VGSVLPTALRLQDASLEKNKQKTKLKNSKPKKKPQNKAKNPWMLCYKSF